MTGRNPRWARVLDEGLQHERTALAWERTAIAAMVAGLLLTRYAAQTAHWVVAMGGLGQTIVGALLLVWSGRHYDDLHGPIRDGGAVVHPTAARLVGVSTVVFSGFAVALAAVEIGAR